MRFPILLINWRGQALKEAEQLGLREVAAEIVRFGAPAGYTASFICDGIFSGAIRRGSEGRFGVPGTFFYADLGGEGTARRECWFILPRGSERYKFATITWEGPADTAAPGPAASPPEPVVPKTDPEAWREFRFSPDMPTPTVELSGTLN